MTDHKPPCPNCHPKLGRPVYTTDEGKCVECGKPFGNKEEFSNGQKCRLQVERICNLLEAYSHLRLEGSGLSSLSAQELHAATGWLCELEDQRGEIARRSAQRDAQAQAKAERERAEREEGENRFEQAAASLRRKPSARIRGLQ